jgi:hypothetical protein
MTGEVLNVTELRKADRTNAERQRRYRARLRRKPADARVVTPTVMVSGVDAVTVLALAAAVSLASVSAFFAVTGMVAIFAAAAIPVTVMTGALEASKLVTAAWLARYWKATPFLLRAPLIIIVLVLMGLTAAATFGFLTRAYLTHRLEAAEAIDRDAAPLAQRIALAESSVRDLDARVQQLDAIVLAATTRGRTTTAMSLVADQNKLRAELIGQRRAAAERLADLRVEQAGIEARRARVASDSGPALYLAKLFRSNDTEGAVRIVTAVLVFVLDPTAVLLTLAIASRGRLIR